MQELHRKRDELRAAIKSAQADLRIIEAALKLLGEAPPSKRIFGRGQLSRLVFDAMRQGVSGNTEIAAYVIRQKGWDENDHGLLVDMRCRVKDVTKRIPTQERLKG